MKKLIKGRKVSVTWMDAAGQQKADKEMLESVTPGELLVRTETYGILFNYDDRAVLILQEDSDSQADYTVIPLGDIVDIHYFKSKKGKG